MFFVNKNSTLDHQIHVFLKQKSNLKKNLNQGSDIQTNLTYFSNQKISQKLKENLLKEKILFLTILKHLINQGYQPTEALNLILKKTDNLKILKNKHFFSDSNQWAQNLKKLNLLNNLEAKILSNSKTASQIESALIQIIQTNHSQQSINFTLNHQIIKPTILIILLAIVLEVLHFFYLPILQLKFNNQFIDQLTAASFVFFEICIVLLCLTIINFLIQIKIGKNFFDKIPIINRLTNTYYTLIFLNTLATAYRVNLYFSMALIQTSFDCKNFKYQQIFINIGDELKKGKALSEILQNYQIYFDYFLVKIIAVAEKTGLSNILLQDLKNFFQIKLYKQISIIKLIIFLLHFFAIFLLTLILFLTLLAAVNKI
ncbi:MAG: hypothetical protein GF332_01370 [Candidatus Moranbacteria bacterium]|nr:hypothetical protein [Candidatus Moranbacteria bacterium]